MTPASSSAPYLVEQGSVPDADAEAVLDAAALAPVAAEVIEVTGPGALDCLQGLFTNDLQRPGDGAFLYGAVLSPKGMILSDLWTLRREGSVFLVVPSDGRAAVDLVLQKSLPPRLARPASRPTIEVWRLAGPRALEVAASAGLPVPEPGRSASCEVAGAAVLAARPQAAAPFGLELHAEADRWPAIKQALGAAGAREAGPRALEIARILAGWPRLGAEIDEKTLPQEVRFDDLDGVSYTKGCYTGQETVARVHFRGHVNRVMAGLWWTAPPNLRAAPTVVAEDRVVGRVTSVAWVPPFERFVGLAKIRREANRRGRVIAFRATAHIVPLPFPEMI